MRAVWKGAISFGLVSIPVKVVSAIGGEHTVKFHQMHRKDQGRVRYRKVCELDGEELAPNEIVRGYESSDGRVAVVTDDDLADLPLPTARTIEVHGFLAADDVDPLRLGKPYYLTPDTSGAKPYVLMREALRRSDKAAVAKLAMRGHEILALVRVQEDVLVLHQLYWPDEINSTQGVAPTERVRVTDAELDMADTLIDALGTADLAEYHDEYQAAVEELVTAKLEGAAPVEAEAPAEEAGGKVIDLMAALRQSVEEATGGRAAPEPKGADAKKTASKRAPAKKAAGRGAAGAKPAKGTGAAKSAAGRSTARKTAGGKAANRSGTAKSGAQSGKSGTKTAAKRPARKTG
ncbi:Ku protein [Yinghuangia sp. ASG 101]|uniref:non-homologous end joining protein Ku n=1 Tax=Yinghuangia sp. ASG 101 TaxID=2896848 RepID=UPI001E63A01F|nr:Ku protein [Yinghuangia sp. ASG 101]UGQ15191.1 Ku protein [Yinghuangia sp. ASG 101]